MQILNIKTFNSCQPEKHYPVLYMPKEAKKKKILKNYRRNTKYIPNRMRFQLKSSILPILFYTPIHACKAAYKAIYGVPF